MCRAAEDQSGEDRSAAEPIVAEHPDRRLVGVCWEDDDMGCPGLSPEGPFERESHLLEGSESEAIYRRPPLG
jgi:hypothetical protein